jgi:hypothetical protein
MNRPLLLLSILVAVAAHAQTNQPQPGGRLLARRFPDYTIMLPAEPHEAWVASWNDAGQMAVFTNPSNGVVITSQYLKFPHDPALAQAVGNRDRYMDLALRKYCAVQFARSQDPAVMNQPVQIESRTLGKHYFRCCPIWGYGRGGERREGFFCIMLRGPAEKPRFEGETLILTIGYPELIAPGERERVLKTFDVVLQNLSF